jgi:hypothetical protein
MMSPDAVAVEPLNNHQLLVSFADGQRKQFDMTPYLTYPLYRPLLDSNFFNQVRVEYGTVTWEDDIDLSPDTLYLRSVPVID